MPGFVLPHLHDHKLIIFITNILTWFEALLHLAMLKEHRDTNCVFIIEEGCGEQPQKEGMVILVGCVGRCCERVPCSNWPHAESCPPALLPSCRVQGTVLSPENTVPASKESVGECDSKLCNLSFQNVYRSIDEGVPKHPLGKGGGDRRGMMTHSGKL